MPKAVPVTYGDYLEIEAALRKWKFKKIPGEEILMVTVRQGKKKHVIIRRGEVGFQYSQNGLTIKVWTTCLWNRVEECAKAELFSRDTIVSRPPSTDVGWVIILDEQNQFQYFARWTLRTKGFVTRLIQRALITLRRIQKRPACEQCEYPMDIHQRESRATFWKCTRKWAHKPRKPLFEDWDIGLLPKMKEVSEMWRREHYRSARRHEKKMKEREQEQKAQEAA